MPPQEWSATAPTINPSPIVVVRIVMLVIIKTRYDVTPQLWNNHMTSTCSFNRASFIPDSGRLWGLWKRELLYCSSLQGWHRQSADTWRSCCRSVIAVIADQIMRFSNGLRLNFLLYLEQNRTPCVWHCERYWPWIVHCTVCFERRISILLWASE